MRPNVIVAAFLAIIVFLIIVVVWQMDQPKEDFDKALARAEKIIGLANKQTTKAARQIVRPSQPRPRPNPNPPTPLPVHVVFDNPLVVIHQTLPVPASNPSREDQFTAWLRENSSW